jgi:anti-sigma factor RsiW
MACTDPNKNWDHLCEYLEEDINSPLCREFKEHLEQCPECRQNVESIKQTVELFRKSHSSVPLSRDLKRQLLEKVKREQ